MSNSPSNMITAEYPDGAQSFNPSKNFSPQMKSKTVGQYLKREVCRLFSNNTQFGTANAVFYTGAPVNGGYVDSLTTEIPGDADGFFVILSNAHLTQATTVAGISYRVSGDMSARPFNAVTPVAGSFNGGSAGVVIPVATSAALPSYVRSDTTYLSTVPRTDNTAETKRIIHIRVAYTAIGGDTTGTTPLTYWSAGGSGNRWNGGNPSGFKSYRATQAGDLTTNISAGQNPDGGSTIIGIGYIARNKTRVIALTGSSIFEGYQEGDQGRSFMVEGIINSSLSQEADYIPTEYMLLAKGGDVCTNIMNRAMAIYALYKPTVIIHEGFNPNDTATAASISTQRSQLLRHLVFAEQNGIQPYITNALPNTNVGNTASNYDAVSQQRVIDWSKELLSYGTVINLTDKTFASNGLWKAGASADGIHPQESWTTSNLVQYVAKMLSL